MRLREDMIESLPCIIDINRHRPRCRIVIAALNFKFKVGNVLAWFAVKLHRLKAKCDGHADAPVVGVGGTTPIIGQAGAGDNAASVTYATSRVGELAGIGTGRRAVP